MEWYLPVIWAGLIGTAVAMYVVLDGFDLGVGILFPFAADERQRDQMMRSVAPFWDGNETWLILGGGGLLVAPVRAARDPARASGADLPDAGGDQRLHFPDWAGARLRRHRAPGPLFPAGTTHDTADISEEIRKEINPKSEIPRAEIHSQNQIRNPRAEIRSKSEGTNPKSEPWRFQTRFLLPFPCHHQEPLLA